MGKLIFWVVVVFAAMFVLRLVNSARYGTGSGKRASRHGERNGAKPAAMTRCVDCGVFLPSADAVKSPRGPVCGDPQCARRRAGTGS